MMSLIQKQPTFTFIDTLANKFRATDELIISKNEFVFQTGKENKKRKPAIDKNIQINKANVAEGLGFYNDNGQKEEHLSDYNNDLKKIMFITQHKVRQPVTNILGMASLIEQHADSPETIKKIMQYMKQSAIDLDAFTRELTNFVNDLEQKEQNKNK